MPVGEKAHDDLVENQIDAILNAVSDAVLTTDDRFSSIPVIPLTTSSSQPDVERCYRMGASSFITKPQSFSGLVELVSEVSQYWFETVRLPGHVPS